MSGGLARSGTGWGAVFYNITTFKMTALKVYLKHLKQSFRGEIISALQSAPPNCIVEVILVLTAMSGQFKCLIYARG